MWDHLLLRYERTLASKLGLKQQFISTRMKKENDAFAKYPESLRQLANQLLGATNVAPTQDDDLLATLLVQLMDAFLQR